jgi:hypothetical protein
MHNSPAIDRVLPGRKSIGLLAIGGSADTLNGHGLGGSEPNSEPRIWDLIPAAIRASSGLNESACGSKASQRVVKLAHPLTSGCEILQHSDIKGIIERAGLM